MVASGDGRVAPMASSSSHGTSQNPGGGSAYAAALAAPPGAWTISRREVGGQEVSVGGLDECGFRRGTFASTSSVDTEVTSEDLSVADDHRWV